MATRLHLVRHGEVDNPHHVVYASLPGFGLSARGHDQARAVARYLSRQPLVGVWSSPAERALRTAEAIATRAGLAIRVDPAFAEWRLMDRWAGTGWEDLPRLFPGELEAFLGDPTRLDFSPESLADLAGRLRDQLIEIEADHPHGDLVVVSHSAPIRAATLALTGEPLSRFWDHEPGHCSVTTLRSGTPWALETSWEPEAA